MPPARPLVILAGLGLLVAACRGGGDGAPPPDFSADRLDREARIRARLEEVRERAGHGPAGVTAAALEPILALDPDHPLPRLAVLLDAQRRGTLPRAEAVLRSMPGHAGPGGAYGLGVSRFLEGRIEEAEQMLEEARRAYRAAGHASGEAAALTGLGNVRFRSGRRDEAARHYAAARLLAARLGDARSEADLLNNLGNVEQERGDDRAALEAYRRALEIRRSLDDRHGIAAALHNLGLVLRRRKDAAGARAAFEEALRIHRDLRDGAGEVRNRNALGLLHLDAGDAEAAAAELEAALGGARAAGDARGEAISLTNLASLDLRAGRPERARERHAGALAIRRGLKDRAGIAGSLNNLATVQEVLGDGRAALGLYEEGLELARSLVDRRGEAALLLNSGRLRRVLRERDVLPVLEAARDLYRGLGDAQGEAGAQEEIGRALTEAGDLAGAARALDAALAVRRGAGDAAGEALVLDARGMLEWRRGGMSEALADFQQALARARDAADRRGEALVLNHLGNLHFARGDLADALRCQEESLLLRRGLGEPSEEALQLGNLGAVYQALGDREAAAGRLREALRIMERLGDRAGQALARANLGVLLEEDGDAAGALREQRASVRLCEELGDRRGAALGRHGEASALLRLGRPREAGAALERALRDVRAAGDRAAEALVLAGQGEALLRQGRAAEAEGRYREALAIASPLGLREEITRGEAGLADSLAALGRWREALAAYDRAMAALESIRGALASADLKTRYLARAAALYERPITLLWRQARRDPGAGAAERGFAYAERARARALLDLLAETRADLRRDLGPDLRRSEAEAANRLARATHLLKAADEDAARDAAGAEARRAEEDLRRIELDIRRAAPGYARVAYPEPAGPREVRAALRDDEVLLEYLLGDGGSWVWIVTRSGIAWRSLPPRDRIEPLVRRFLASTRSAALALGPSGGAPDGDSLTRFLLPAEALQPGTRLIVVPDGVLHHLPFEALPIRDAAGTVLLLERGEVSYAPSASTLIALRRLPSVPAGEAGILAFGDPSPHPAAGAASHPPLPHAREEVTRLAARFPASRRRLFVGDLATEAALKDISGGFPAILHMAVHGVIDEGAPARSALVLRQGGPDDGLLQMNEIFGLRLPARLVVLSACRSGLGSVIRGEGMVGLTHAFLHAGARAVVVSLWNVGDRSTADLMERFYAGLTAGAAPRTALRQAKLSLLQSASPADRHPERWAGFVLIGDPDGGFVPHRLPSAPPRPGAR